MQGLKFDASTRTINFLNKSQVRTKSTEFNNHLFKTTYTFRSFLFDNKRNASIIYGGKMGLSLFGFVHLLSSVVVFWVKIFVLVGFFNIRLIIFSVG